MGEILRILTAIFSIIALGLSVWATLISNKSLKKTVEKYSSDVKRDLIHQANRINEAFVEYEVKGPYAFHLKIDDEHLKDFTAKVVLMLNQINLLYDVFHHKAVLGERIQYWEKWARDLLNPWIQADNELKNAYRLVRDSKDWMGKDFIAWLEDVMPPTI